jgi:hypothetical protein
VSKYLSHLDINMDRLAWLTPQHYGRRNHFNDALVGYNWADLYICHGFLVDKISSTNFLYARLGPSFFWENDLLWLWSFISSGLLPSAL